MHVLLDRWCTCRSLPVHVLLDTWYTYCTLFMHVLLGTRYTLPVQFLLVPLHTDCTYSYTCCLIPDARTVHATWYLMYGLHGLLDTWCTRCTLPMHVLLDTWWCGHHITHPWTCCLIPDAKTARYPSHIHFVWCLMTVLHETLMQFSSSIMHILYFPIGSWLWRSFNFFSPTFVHIQQGSLANSWLQQSHLHCSEPWPIGHWPMAIQ